MNDKRLKAIQEVWASNAKRASAEEQWKAVDALHKQNAERKNTHG